MQKIFKLIILATSLTSIWSLAGSLTVSVVDKQGKPVPDTVVILTPEGKGFPIQALPDVATIVQEKMQFQPVVSLVPVGAKVSFVNNDSWNHHVKTLSANAALVLDSSSKTDPNGFEMLLEGKSNDKKSKPAIVTMNKVGAQSAVLLSCLLHGSMRGFVYVTDSPWAAKTTAEGQAVFEDVPDGKVQVKVWQSDQLVDVPMQMTVVGVNPTKVTSVLPTTPRRRRS